MRLYNIYIIYICSVNSLIIYFFFYLGFTETRYLYIVSTDLNVLINTMYTCEMKSNQIRLVSK